MDNGKIATESVIQDFIDVTVEVLSTMAQLEVTPKGVQEIEGDSSLMAVTACMDITGVLGFSGGKQGSILVTFPERMALSAVGGMLGMEFTEVDGDVRDGVGEIVNMIAGSAKTRLQNRGINFELSIPNTVVGANHQIAAPASTRRTRIDFNSTSGGFFIEVYLKDQN